MSKSLEELNFPDDLKQMSIVELEELSTDIRKFLINSISKTGGHLASNLGVVELTIAMHKVFDSPKDKFIWDVGHQSYVHKILTNRSKDFDTLRKFRGLSGFPKRKESKHDIYETGHSSTSISAAIGVATANKHKGIKGEVIAVIGDGSLTGGSAFEAINFLGHSDDKVIIVLNDNGMSISKNIGGLSQHLTDLRISKGYRKLKITTKKNLPKIPLVGKGLTKVVSKAKDKFKLLFMDSGLLFESWGLTYIGPIDGHDLEEMIEIFQSTKDIDGPIIIHLITKKGKGYKIAEELPDKFHGVGPFDVSTGKTIESSKGISYSNVFGKAVVDSARKDENVVVITAAMCSATGLSDFEKKFPKRCFDVGIAEGHGVNFAAGLAIGGLKPIVAIYSTFIQRAYDQIIMDVCLQNLPVVFALDRAGIVGADGETHHGIFDISFLSSIPNLTILTPSTGNELYNMIDFALKLNAPCAIRYPRGNTTLDEDLTKSTIFTGENTRLSGTDRENLDVDIWAVGSMISKAIEAKEILQDKGYNVGIVKVIKIKPMSLEHFNSNTKVVVTIEDNLLTGGFGQQFLANTKGKVPMINIAWPDKFIEHGTQDELYNEYGFSSYDIAERVCEHFERKA